MAYPVTLSAKAARIDGMFGSDSIFNFGIRIPDFFGQRNLDTGICTPCPVHLPRPSEDGRIARAGHYACLRASVTGEAAAHAAM